MTSNVFLDGPDLNSPVSEISTRLADLEGLPKDQRGPMVEAQIGYLKTALESRKTEAAPGSVAAGDQTPTRAN